MRGSSLRRLLLPSKPSRRAWRCYITLFKTPYNIGSESTLAHPFHQDLILPQRNTRLATETNRLPSRLTLRSSAVPPSLARTASSWGLVAGSCAAKRSVAGVGVHRTRLFASSAIVGKMGHGEGWFCFILCRWWQEQPGLLSCILPSIERYLRSWCVYPANNATHPQRTLSTRP